MLLLLAPLDYDNETSVVNRPGSLLINTADARLPSGPPTSFIEEIRGALYTSSTEVRPRHAAAPRPSLATSAAAVLRTRHSSIHALRAMFLPMFFLFLFGGQPM